MEGEGTEKWTPATPDAYWLDVLADDMMVDALLGGLDTDASLPFKW
jgi:hypothetical protein